MIFANCVKMIEQTLARGVKRRFPNSRQLRVASRSPVNGRVVGVLRLCWTAGCLLLNKRRYRGCLRDLVCNGVLVEDMSDLATYLAVHYQCRYKHTWKLDMLLIKSLPDF